MKYIVVGLVRSEYRKLDAELDFAVGLEAVIDEVPVFRDFTTERVIKHDFTEYRFIKWLVMLSRQQQGCHTVFASAARGNIHRAAHRSNSILKLTYLPPVSSSRITAS